jgi:hypothetical protein
MLPTTWHMKTGSRMEMSKLLYQWTHQLLSCSEQLDWVKASGRFHIRIECKWMLFRCWYRFDCELSTNHIHKPEISRCWPIISHHKPIPTTTYNVLSDFIIVLKTVQIWDTLIHIPVRKYDHFLSVKSLSYMYVCIYIYIY